MLPKNVSISSNISNLSSAVNELKEAIDKTNQLSSFDNKVILLKEASYQLIQSLYLVRDFQVKVLNGSQIKEIKNKKNEIIGYRQRALWEQEVMGTTTAQNSKNFTKITAYNQSSSSFQNEVRNQDIVRVRDVYFKAYFNFTEIMDKVLNRTIYMGIVLKTGETIFAKEQDIKLFGEGAFEEGHAKILTGHKTLINIFNEQSKTDDVLKDLQNTFSTIKEQNSLVVAAYQTALNRMANWQYAKLSDDQKKKKRRPQFWKEFETKMEYMYKNGTYEFHGRKYLPGPDEATKYNRGRVAEAYIRLLYDSKKNRSTNDKEEMIVFLYEKTDTENITALAQGDVKLPTSEYGAQEVQLKSANATLGSIGPYIRAATQILDTSNSLTEQNIKEWAKSQVTINQYISQKINSAGLQTANQYIDNVMAGYKTLSRYNI